MASLKVWGRRSAFNVQKVLWLLDELDLEFEHVEIGGEFGGLDEPAFLKMNPHGRVPVVADGENVIWESHSILRYLAAEFGSKEIWPLSPVIRSESDRWMDWGLATFQPDFMRLFWGYYRTPEGRRDQRRIDSALQGCDAHFRLLDTHLASRPFLGGSEFSLADIPIGSSLYRYFEMGIEVPRHQHVDAWHARLSQRPAFQAQIAIPFDALRGRMDF